MIRKWIERNYSPPSAGSGGLTSVESRREAKDAKLGARSDVTTALRNSSEVEKLTSGLKVDASMNHFTELLLKSIRPRI